MSNHEGGSVCTGKLTKANRMALEWRATEAASEAKARNGTSFLKYAIYMKANTKANADYK